MPKPQPLAALDRSDPTVLDHLAKTQRVCLIIVVLIAIVTLCAWVSTGIGIVVPAWSTLMKVNTALIALASAISLMLSESHRSRRSALFSRILAVFVLVVALSSLLEHTFGISLGLDTLIAADPASPSSHPGLMSPQSASSFSLLAVVLLFVRSRMGFARHLADGAVASLSILVMVVISGYVFGAPSLFGTAPSNWTSPQALVSLMLLSFVAFGRRAEHGDFSILVESGIGSRIARTLTPVLLALPFLREAGRLRLVHSGLLPEHYTTAIFASAAAAMSLALLIFLAWRINGMENEIQALSLRDELTGLCNLRGFRVLAEQALRQARRLEAPFSVLYVDVDNLKRINDTLGHSTGSAYLVETADVLRSTFRESDVVGRIGGDEFAVAGQFTDAGISAAAERLQAGSELKQPDFTGQIRLSISIGYATTDEHGTESLEDLLARADKAMYEQKKQKKHQRK
jgi:diguanylate cyclase (GGDEF)-like protein